MKCFLINLERSPDRLVAMENIFGAAGIVFERAIAIDGKQLSEAALQASTVARHDYRPLTASEVGCFLSHRACWERIAAGPDAFAAVFEDDIAFSRNGASCLKESVWIPADADVVKLETYVEKVWVDKKPVAKLVDYSIRRLRSIHWGTAGYVISRTCAARLVNSTNTFSVTVDDALFNPKYRALRTIVAYQMVPALCIQKRFSDDKNVALAFQSTVESHASGPETATLERRGLKRRLARLGEKVVRRLRQQTRLSVPFEMAEDSI